LVHHVELYVSSLPVSAQWWGALLTRLGWTPYQSWGDGISWRSRDGGYLVLVQVADDARNPPYDRRRVGLNHLALRGGSPAQVDALVIEMLAHGTRLLYADRYPWAGGRAHYAAYVEDPDGIKVELVADPAPR
jgi:catechol 2,3-dioxygenase-like lactoylglutathione lyase family enzyme